MFVPTGTNTQVIPVSRSVSGYRKYGSTILRKPTCQLASEPECKLCTSQLAARFTSLAGSHMNGVSHVADDTYSSYVLRVGAS